MNNSDLNLDLSSWNDVAIGITLAQAEKGDPSAQFALGLMFELGKGLPKDPLKAIHWYSAAAESEHMHAQHNLAVLLLRKGSPHQDERRAIKLLIAAASEGSSPSQFLLGKCYAEGLGCHTDFTAALAWFRRAAKQKYEPAKSWVAKIRALVGKP